MHDGVQKGKININPVMVLLWTNVFYQVFFNSSWRERFSGDVGKYVGYSLIALLMVVVVINLLRYVSKIEIMIPAFILVFLGIYLIWFGNLTVGTTFLFAIIALLYNPEKIFEVYYWATITAVAIVILLSLTSVLPLHDSLGGALTLGFRNVNTTGFYIGILLIEYAAVNPKRVHFLYWITYGIGLMVEYLLFGDKTIVGVMIAFALLVSVDRVKPALFKNKLVRAPFSILPFILGYTAFSLANDFGTTAFSLKVNHFLTNRVFIWNYYLITYPAHWLPAYKQLSMKQINMNVFSASTFDGAYVAYPLSIGWFLSILCLVTFSLYIYIYMKKNSGLAIVGIIFVILGFSESLILSFYQSPVAVVALGIGLKSLFQRKERKV